MAPSAQNVGLLAAVGATVRLTPPGLAGFGIRITGTWAGTVQFEGSIDGVTFAALSATPIGGTVSATQATVNGVWQAAAPLVSMQVRMSAFSSGQAVVTLNAVEAATGGAAASGGGGGGGAVTIADGADAATGSTTDPAVVGDNPGTISSKLRGINKILNDVWDAVNHRLHVVVDNTVAIPVGPTTGSFQVQANSVVPGTGATQLGKAVDNAAGATDTGVAELAVRDDALTTLTPVDGDYVPNRTNARGAKWVAIEDGSGGQITTFSGGTQYTEDVPKASPPVGTAPILIRKDTPAATVSNDGDNIAQRGTNFGAGYVTVLDAAGAPGVITAVTSITNVVHVDDNAASLSVDWNGTQPVTGHGTATGALRVELPTDGTGLVTTNPATPGNWAIYVEDAGETVGGNLMMAGTVRRDTAASSAGTTGDNATLNTNRDGALWVVGAAGPSGGWSVATGSIGATKTDIGTANTAGQVGGWYIFNANTTAVYLQAFNAQASAVTLGTTPPVYSLGIPAGAAANVAPGMVGLAHATAISIAITTTRAGATGPSATVDYNLWYKQ